MPKERSTCTECSMRRQKCDRQMPCGRCVKRGDASKCTREWPKEGYDPKVHRIYPRPSKENSAGDGTVEEPVTTSPTADGTEDDDGVLNQPSMSPSGGEATLHPSLRGPARQIFSAVPQPDFQAASPSTSNKKSNRNHKASGSSGSSSSKELEFLTWGKLPLSSLQLPAIQLQKESPNPPPPDSTPNWTNSNGFGGTTDAQISFLQSLIPHLGQLNELVRHHNQKVAWYPSMVHCPTFERAVREATTKTGRIDLHEVDLRWAALLFSIMAASMTCASDAAAVSWGFQKADKPNLTRSWFRATISCLNLADYMDRHHIHSVQAIIMLTMSSHILGFSNTQSTLMGTALKIAQGLGLQRLGPEEAPDDLSTSAGREKLIRRETGRRVWSQLCIQDWFSIPFSEMYSIQRHHFTTIQPLNLDEETMTPRAEPTKVTFTNYMQDLARIMADAHDAIVTANDLFAKFDEAIRYETRIKSWIAELPPFLSMGEPILPQWPRTALWARRSLLICASHKIIMIHRNFLGRSFTDSNFLPTRVASMDAAKTILREAQLNHEEDGPTLWIDQAFMVAAGITLALDIFHRKPDDPQFDEHRRLVQNDINLLAKQENSMIAARGIRLLSSLLTEQAQMSASQTLDQYRKRVREPEDDDLYKSSSASASASASNFISPFSADATAHPKRQRQKFDVPRFIENMGSGNSFVNNLGLQSMATGQLGLPRTVAMLNPQSLYQGQQPMLGSGQGAGPGSGSSADPGTGLNAPLTGPTPAATQQPNFHNANNVRNHSIAYSSSSTMSRPSTASASTAATTTNTTAASANNNVAGPGATNMHVNFSNIPGTPTTPASSVGGAGAPDQFQFNHMDYGYETFAELFPPQTGMSNAFLFEDLLNFDL